MIQAVTQRKRPRRRLAVDVTAAVNLIGMLGKYLGLAALFPVPFALGYGEPVWPFLATGAIVSGLGFALERMTAGAAQRVGVREGFLVVSATWLLAAAFAALPYLFIGGDQLDHPLDAYFEGMSGVTTTGASVVTDLDGINRSLGIWRQFTQWMGGMGIIVLAIAVLPRLRVGGRQLLESEMPGPEIAQLSERIRQTARNLWFLYIGLTVLQTLLLSAMGWLGIDEEMTPYEALAHAFSTMPTGGFSTRPRSAEEFAAASQWILAAFMLIAGANFALMYVGFLRRKPRVLLRDEELRLYLAIAAIATAVVTAMIWGYGIAEGEEAVRTGFFQAVSIITTTGMASTDFALWPAVLLLSLFALMFVGGSAGSTGGSIKVVRHLLLGKVLRRELDQTVSPEVVMPIRLNGSPVDERTLRAIAAFILLYVGFWAVGAGTIAIDSAITGAGLGTLDSLAVSATTLGNVGPAFGIAGPMGSFAALGDVSKITLIGLMWAGRLEIVPVVVLLTRHYWRL
ncbi:MAG: TrkH family potassium uptake protein [Actinobacteria bacterium]|nr:TrkH family potassium uptake protein [Actinomycetota bacterium]